MRRTFPGCYDRYADDTVLADENGFDCFAVDHWFVVIEKLSTHSSACGDGYADDTVVADENGFVCFSVDHSFVVIKKLSPHFLRAVMDTRMIRLWRINTDLSASQSITGSLPLRNYHLTFLRAVMDTRMIRLWRVNTNKTHPDYNTEFCKAVFFNDMMSKAASCFQHKLITFTRAITSLEYEIERPKATV